MMGNIYRLLDNLPDEGISGLSACSDVQRAYGIRKLTFSALEQSDAFWDDIQEELCKSPLHRKAIKKRLRRFIEDEVLDDI